MAKNDGSSPYDQGLEKNPANFAALTPLSFLRHTAAVYPDYPAVIDGDLRLSWREVFARCRRLASALSQRGIKKGDTVAVLAPNVTAMLEAHFAVPATGAVLNAINTRLDAATVAYILDHGEAKIFIVDGELAGIAKEALALCKAKPLVIDAEAPGLDLRLGEITYEDFLAGGDAEFAWTSPKDEWEAISLNYTSGTTGDPKGVVYHHRGAAINALGNVQTWDMPHHPVYLWTLPMFHCNGWCFPWTVTLQAGTHVCLRKVTGDKIVAAIEDHKVTHLSGAPIVMQMILEALAKRPKGFGHVVRMMTAAAPPPASVLEAMGKAGIDVTHVYGLTEVYGPAVVSAWHHEWDTLPITQQAALKARQGVPYALEEDLMVADPDSLEPVARDGASMGEVMIRGNIVMKGYLKDKAASDKAFKGGWFHTGDLGVWHPDGYIELKDRSKDIIISGGENISSIEVEGILYKHEAVAAVAVVARPDDKWGETPCAFVELRQGKSASEEELITFCRDNMAHFKAPKTVIFEELPKTSTGKIQKFILRERAKGL